jgi:virginiamycin B lyase
VAAVASGCASAMLAAAGALAAGPAARAAGAGTITLFPTSVSAPLDVVTGPDGDVWFDEFWDSRIGRITPSGTITEFQLANGAGPYDIAVGRDTCAATTVTVATGEVRVTNLVTHRSLIVRAPHSYVATS